MDHHRHTKTSGQETVSTADWPRQPQDDGWTIGNYRVVQALGEGGFGVVYLAEQIAPVRRRVALKIIKPGLDSAAVLARFEVERQVLGALHHANIAQLLDAGLTPDGRPYFVMEYVEGMPLDEYCDAQELSVHERLRLFLRVCAAVHYAHQNLIIHRDIKPEHILVTAEGEPKLLDFGIAKLLNPQMMGAATSLPEGRLLTPAYASPEQVLGQPITTASDIYSLGIVLYELLTGHSPYPAESLDRTDLIRHVTDHEPQAPSAVASQDAPVHPARRSSESRPAADIARRRGTKVLGLRRTLRGDLDQIVLMAMRKTPRRRYSSVLQFAEDIQRYLDSRPVIARPETWTYVASRFARRNRGAVVTTVLSFVLLLGAVGVVSWQARQLSVANSALDARYGLIRDSVWWFLEGLHEEVRVKPGSSAAGRLLVETSMDVLEKFEEQVGTDQELMRLMASGYRRLGEACDLVYAESGDEPSDKALRSFERAVELYAELVRAQPSDHALRLDAAKAEVLLGKALALVGHSDQAQAQYDLALAQVESNEGAAKDERLAVEAFIREQIGNLLRRRGDPGRAMVEYQRALSIRERLRPTAEDRIQALVDVAWNHFRIAGCHMDQEAFSDAEAEAALALKDLAAAATIQPNNVDRSRTVLKARALIGRARLNSGALDKARPELEEALKIATAHYREDKRSRSAAEQYMLALENLGDLEFQSNNYAAALTRYQSFLHEAEAISDLDEPWVPARNAVAMAHEKIGDCHRQQREYLKAIGSYREAARRFAAIHAEDRGHVLSQDSSFRALASVADALSRSGDDAEAAAVADRVVAEIEAEPSEPERPRSHERQRAYLNALVVSAQAAAALDDYPKSIARFNQAIDIAQRAPAPLDSRVPRWHYNLGRIYKAVPEGAKNARAHFDIAAQLLTEPDRVQIEDADRKLLMQRIEDEMTGLPESP